MSPHVTLEPGTVINATYQCTAVAAQGGMGVVYSAIRLRDGLRVAIKVLRPEIRCLDDFTERLRREAIAAQKIQSPFITKVLDVVDDERVGTAIVFEYLEGETLEALLRRKGRLSLSEAYPITCQMLSGLCHAHAVPVIHRDLKPGNVYLVQAQGHCTQAKLLDFGISKLPPEYGFESLTRVGQNLGSFYYMAPEQMDAPSNVDHRADLYACGVIIFRILTGQLPHLARGIAELVKSKRTTEARRLNDAISCGQQHFAPELESFVTRLLARDPNDRFESAENALKAWQSLPIWYRTPEGDIAAS